MKKEGSKSFEYDIRDLKSIWKYLWVALITALLADVAWLTDYIIANWASEYIATLLVTFATIAWTKFVQDNSLKSK